MKGLYAITAISEGNPVGAFVLAMNADDAAHKASARLGESGRMTHLYRLCDATASTLKRNQLLQNCSKADQVEFVTETLLEIVDVMQRQVVFLQSTVTEMARALEIKEKMQSETKPFKIFRFAVQNPEGEVKFYETMAPSLGPAFKVAMNFAKSQYGPEAKPDFIAEVPDDE
ncbi:hypothetical protein [Blastopirellula marina]|uniref:Uncharacterized protein n=1 Tax=Blastopirellula marina DSM 3645 TaxID=314230 RepID=A3ZPQ9_9BACT|nr:hypothetical protein [Blastopirellula marina]EAQ81737.1 hypothetical protein DSM3645_29187 [Blastopirellula marina DSM 3645]